MTEELDLDGVKLREPNSGSFVFKNISDEKIYFRTASGDPIDITDAYKMSLHMTQLQLQITCLTEENERLKMTIEMLTKGGPL